MTITASDTTAPATIAEITDPRLRAVVHAFVTVVEEAENTEEGETAKDADGKGATTEEAWADLDDERDIVIAAAQACIDALDALATTGTGQKSLLDPGHDAHLAAGGERGESAA